MICRICSEEAVPFAEATLLRAYTVHYFQCKHCGFVQTEQPYWLEEAYSSAINNSDIGLISRNISFSRSTRALILAFFNSNAKFMDYGGGYGLFVRMMRDVGLNFYWSDKFCENLFAKGFEVEGDGTNQYELITAFEVFEHLVDPLTEIRDMLRYSRSILFSTILLPQTNPRPGEWWYYGLEHGQHVSLYTPKSLSCIAAKLGLNVYSYGNYLHLLTNKKIPSFLFRLVPRYRISGAVNVLMSKFLQKRSLLADDYYGITGVRLRS